MAQASPASIFQNLTVQQAATAVISLINSRPRSPRQDEIEAILARVVSTGSAPASPLLANIRETSARLHDAFGVLGKVHPSDKEAEAAAQNMVDGFQNQLDELADEIPRPPQAFMALLIGFAPRLTLCLDPARMLA